MFVGLSLWIQSPEMRGGGTNLSLGSSLMMVPDVGMSGICLLGSWQSPPPGHLVSVTPHQSTSRRSHQSARYLKQNLRGCQDLISAKWGNCWVTIVVSGNKENNFHPGYKCRIFMFTWNFISSDCLLCLILHRSELETRIQTSHTAAPPSLNLVSITTIIK